MTKEQRVAGMRVITKESNLHAIIRTCPKCKKRHCDNKWYGGNQYSKLLSGELGDWCLVCVHMETLIPCE